MESPKPKKLKQFVIVKEYYGQDNNAATTKSPKKKREYIEKTILKEQIEKGERDSLATLFPKETKETKETKEKKYIELEEEEDDEDDRKLVPYMSNRRKKATFSTLSTVDEDMLKTGFIYGLLAAGGMIGAYSVMKNSSLE